MTLTRLFETKAQRAKRLPVGTWFVWPDTTPVQYEYYQPKVYRVLDNHQTVRSEFEDIGLWYMDSGANSPQAAYDRAAAIVAALNNMNADLKAANAHIHQQVRSRALDATSTLSKMLLRVDQP